MFCFVTSCPAFYNRHRLLKSLLGYLRPWWVLEKKQRMGDDKVSGWTQRWRKTRVCCLLSPAPAPALFSPKNTCFSLGFSALLVDECWEQSCPGGSGMGLNNREAGQLFALGCLLAWNTRDAIPPLAGWFQPLSMRCSEITVRWGVGIRTEHVFVMDWSTNLLLVKSAMSCDELCSVIPWIAGRVKIHADQCLHCALSHHTVVAASPMAWFFKWYMYTIAKLEVQDLEILPYRTRGYEPLTYNFELEFIRII